MEPTHMDFIDRWSIYRGYFWTGGFLYRGSHHNGFKLNSNNFLTKFVNTWGKKKIELKEKNPCNSFKHKLNLFNF